MFCICQFGIFEIYFFKGSCFTRDAQCVTGSIHFTKPDVARLTTIFLSVGVSLNGFPKALEISIQKHFTQNNTSFAYLYKTFHNTEFILIITSIKACLSQWLISTGFFVQKLSLHFTGQFRHDPFEKNVKPSADAKKSFKKF